MRFSCFRLRLLVQFETPALRKSDMSNRRKSPPRYRPSFTLVELMVAVSIIGIMAGMVLYSLLGAQTDARNARTRGTVQKLNEIVLQRWEEFRYKAIDVTRTGIQTSPGTLAPPNTVLPRETARLRMIALRDSMRMEMPDRISDLLYGPTQYTVVFQNTATSGLGAGKVPRAVPNGFGLLYNALRNAVINLQVRESNKPFQFNNPDQKAWSNFNLINIDSPPGSSPVLINLASGTAAPYDPVVHLAIDPANPPPNWAGTDIEWNRSVQTSELLYLFVASSRFAGSSALEFFRPSEIGDSDNDGMLEFIDAWGQPISWIRWPAGYPSDLVRYADDDAMDPVRTDWRYVEVPASSRGTIASDWKPRTLVPLIVSAGADGQFGITFNFSTGINYALMTWPDGSNGLPFGTTTPLHYSPAGGYYYPDPFFTINNMIPAPPPTASAPNPGYRWNQLGSIPTAGEPFAADNITNHDIILEP